MNSFHYVHPESVDEALQEYAKDPSGLIPYAGGTDLMVLFRSDPKRFEGRRFLCLDRIEEMRQIRLEQGSVRIGAMCRYSGVLESDIIQEHAPLLRCAAEKIASPQIRNMATVAGNIVNASPAADGLAALTAMQAVVHTAGHREGVAVFRDIPIEDFVTGPRKTALHPGELVISVSVPGYPGLPFVYEKIGLRNAMAIAVVSIAIQHIRPGGRVSLAIGSAGPRVIRSREAEELIAAGEADRAIRLYMDLIAPISDIRATGEYRRKVVFNLLNRCLKEGES